ncbi:MAG: SDR family NAD(P)-dependent oxidoreductase [Hyphomonas sp.]
MRALTHAKAFDYSARSSLAALGTIEITDAEPGCARALADEIAARGGQARIVSTPTPGGTCILTEALSSTAPADRHHAALKGLLAHSEGGGRTYVLDRFARGEIADIGGCAGMCRSVRIERPDCRAYSLSVDGGATLRENAARVVSALTAPEDDYSLYADGGWRDVPGAELSPPTGPTPSGPPPVWLVTGGARGVTADCAIELSRRTGGTFLLLGRSGLDAWPDWLPRETDLKALRGQLARHSSHSDAPKKPVEIDRLARRLLASAEIAATLEAIAQSGAKGVYVQADIGNAADVRRVLSEAQTVEGRITGFVHGAGVLADGRAETLGLQDFEKVLDPKVGGLETVLSCLDTSALTHIAMFSSASAVFGNEGQANYAAANDWLNNVAEQLARSLPGAQVKSFCWGPWAGGMVDEALARMFTERGIGLISRPEGARIFADMLLWSPRDQVRFVVGDEWGVA